jgi:hypothetical protein
MRRMFMELQMKLNENTHRGRDTGEHANMAASRRPVQ